jgi:hypothetical protein
MKAKKPASKKAASKKPTGTWVEMTGFKSKSDQSKCLELFKAGYAHEFRKSLLRIADGKLWFLVRDTTFTGRQRSAREITQCTVDVNRKGGENLSRRLLGMLRADQRRKRPALINGPDPIESLQAPGQR